MDSLPVVPAQEPAQNDDKSNGSPHTNGAPTPPAEKKPTNAELKRQAKAEKAAKRAADKASQGPQTPSPASSASQQSQKPQPQKGQQKATAQQKQQAQQAQDALLQKETDRQLPPSKPRRGSETRSRAPAVQPPKRVDFFNHLYKPQTFGITGASKDVHPAVLASAEQMHQMEIVGSNARCEEMLKVFQRVIQAYTTPPGTSLARHLIPHHLSPQIAHYSSRRNISVGMGNAIRWLKDLIVKIDPSVPESEAKASLIAAIDLYIRERITAADTLISESAAQKIVGGDVILTYAQSSVVKKTLLYAHKQGTKFRVICVDSKPFHEGKVLAAELVDYGLDVSYSLITAASHAIKEATKVFVGAHAMLGNGRLYSRVGTAVVAMLAHTSSIPVIVCCESYKFTERVALDSIVLNEVSPAEELFERGPEGEKMVERWKETSGLQFLNIMYDVTPDEFVYEVVTEYASLPPKSVPAMLRSLGTI